MRKNLQHFLTLAFLICCTSIHSQQQYELQHYGGPGTVYLYNNMAGLIPVPEITEAGANVVWDVSLNAMLNTNPRQIVTPSQGIDQATFITICTLSGLSFLECISVWSQTEQALITNDSIGLFGFALHDLKRYQNKTSNLLLENFFGFTVDFGGMPTNAVIVYQQPDTIFNFPIVYNKSWTS